MQITQESQRAKEVVNTEELAKVEALEDLAATESAKLKRFLLKQAEDKSAKKDEELLAKLDQDLKNLS